MDKAVSITPEEAEYLKTFDNETLLIVLEGDYVNIGWVAYIVLAQRQVDISHISIPKEDAMMYSLLCLWYKKELKSIPPAVLTSFAWVDNLFNWENK